MPMSPQQELSLMMLQILLGASQKGAALTMPMNSVIVRVKRGRKVGVRGGDYAYEPGRVLIALPDESILNLKGPEEAKNLWLISNIQREIADQLIEGKPEPEEPKIFRPTLVGPDGRPVH